MSYRDLKMLLRRVRGNWIGEVNVGSDFQLQAVVTSCTEGDLYIEFDALLTTVWI